jgi:hypothetical protein
LLVTRIRFPWNWSCWLELSENCIREGVHPPSWPFRSYFEASPNSADIRVAAADEHASSSIHIEIETESEVEEERSEAAAYMYQCFLAHYYLELQNGEDAMKVSRVAFSYEYI